MDDRENYSRYQTKASGMKNEKSHSSSIRLKLPSKSATMNPRESIQYADEDDDDDDVEDEEMVEELEESHGGRKIGKDSYDDEDDEEDDVSGDDDDDDVEEEEEDEEDNVVNRYNGKVGDFGVERPQKKRKVKNLISNYEFAPRARALPAHVSVQSQPSSVGQVAVRSWSDHETFALLDAWGERFLQQGRKSLRSEEWQEVAEKVSQLTDIERTDSQCRNRVDTLKKKYMKEKMKSASGGGGVSQWVFFRKMDMLLSSPSQRPGSLSCGIDSGQYVFMNPKVYLNRANVLDEMRDSPSNSESSRDDEDEKDGLSSKGKKNKAKSVDRASFQLLADSLQKFSDLYEDIEINKQKQMVELENMRMDIQRQIEIQRREILERAQAEIVKIRGGGGDDENDLSAENASG